MAAATRSFRLQLISCSTDEGNMDWWNQGSIRFNSSLPIPEPRTLSFLCFAAMAALIRYKWLTSVTRNR